MLSVITQWQEQVELRSVKKRIVLGAGVLALVALAFVAREAWLHLEAGYQIQVGFEGGPYKTYDIVFPFWRKILGSASLAVIAAGILLWMSEHSHAFSILLAGSTSVAALGLYDVWQYGTMGTPTSLGTWLFVAASFAAAITGKRLGVLH
jgi:hypothetical protein